MSLTGAGHKDDRRHYRDDRSSGSARSTGRTACMRLWMGSEERRRDISEKMHGNLSQWRHVSRP